MANVILAPEEKTFSLGRAFKEKDFSGISSTLAVPTFVVNKKEA
jgi:hypothetical protein